MFTMSTHRCLVYVIYFYICVQLFDIDIVIYKCAEQHLQLSWNTASVL